MEIKEIKILLVEDNEGDILLTKEAFEDSKILVDIHVAKDGEEAIKYLTKVDHFKEASTPDLILLDVNLPKKNGHEVLSHIKNDSALKHLPVIMLTTSSSESDIVSSYNNHVNCYITKPVNVDDFMKVILSIEDFWFTIVKLPKSR